MALDPDTEKCLLTLKKSGKPCKFVLVSKGPDVQALVAYRKGALEGKKAEARKLAKGELSWGVIDGKSLNISFKLLRTDGFETPPVQEKKLKTFLNDDNGQAFRPTIEIVEALPDVADDEQPQSGGYRSGEEWKGVLAAIQSEADQQTRVQLVSQAARDWKAENDQVKQALANDSDDEAAQAQEKILGKVGEIIRALHQSSQPPPPQQTPPRPTRPAPTRAQGKLDELSRERTAILSDAKARVDQAKPARDLYKLEDINQIIHDCETRPGSDFAQIAELLVHEVEGKKQKRGKLHDEVVNDLQQARELAQKYIDEHKDPRIGKLPARVRKRREACQGFVTQITQYLDEIENKNNTVSALCKTYRDRLQAGGFVPVAVCGELKELLNHPLVSGNSKTLIKVTMELIHAESKKQGFEELKQHQNIGSHDKAELLEAYGCFSGTAGGTSDVKLLQNPDGSIAFAFKGAANESINALDFLNLPPGACTIREDLSSTLVQEVQKLTQLDLGFPPAIVTKLNGTTGALVDGIPGQMADPEEVRILEDKLLQLQGDVNRLTNEGVQGLELDMVVQQRDDLDRKVNAKKQALESVPDQISQDSLTNVMLSSVLTCQWDCKWGNMIVQGDQARPIDGGTAIPTKDVVTNFVGNWRGGFPPQMLSLVKYPEGHSKQGQVLPTAQLPMSKRAVDAILKLKPDDLVAAGKARRDKLLNDFPDFNTQPSLVEDSCFDIVKASIEGAQNILRANPQITLEQFASEYEKWFMAWGTKYLQG
jgi:hypothetical protein